MPIENWEDLPHAEYRALLVGNGLSVRFHAGFGYRSLLRVAADNGLIGEDLQKVFQHLQTSDFEHVLRMLWHTREIQAAFGIKAKEVTDAYGHLRHALIEAVRTVHVEHAAVKDQLIPLSGFLQRFPTVISLNYDLLVYWAIMEGNGRLGGAWFKDCFVRGSFQSDWGFLRQPARGVEGSTLVFYPHGNLAIGADRDGAEFKVAASDTKHLLDVLRAETQTPVFVSEGSTEQKMASISRSGYLSQVYSGVFGELEGGLIVFGWSMSDADRHIIAAIPRSVTSIAISIHNPADGGEEKCDAYRQVLRRRSDIQLRFFDASTAPLN